MHEICSSHFGVKVSSGKVDRPVSELWFLHSTSPTQQHPNLSAHFKARETAGMGCVCVCVFNIHKSTLSSFHTYGSFSYGHDWSITSCISAIEKQRAASGRQTDEGGERRKDKQTGSAGDRDRQGGRQEDS